MSVRDISELAEQISIMVQLDRMRHDVGTAVDFKAQDNVSQHLASVFERAKKAYLNLTPKE